MLKKKLWGKDLHAHALWEEWAIAVAAAAQEIWGREADYNLGEFHFESSFNNTVRHNKTFLLTSFCAAICFSFHSGNGSSGWHRTVQWTREIFCWNSRKENIPLCTSLSSQALLTAFRLVAASLYLLSFLLLICLSFPSCVFSGCVQRSNLLASWRSEWIFKMLHQALIHYSTGSWFAHFGTGYTQLHI